MPSNKGTSWETKGALTFKSAYKLYKHKSNNPVSEKVYKEVIDACNTEFMRMLVEDGKVMRMPFLSKVQIIKTQKPSLAQIDYDLYNKTGEKRSFENLHSDGYRPRLHWLKSAIPIVGVLPYSLKLNRLLTQAMSTEMKKPGGHAKYPELNYGK
ncbi:hypothetical protein [Tenacibaculum sp.]|uniref:hypothetical protein n=1 Tax=Tenacibaculum sp. TaxID=1906242 RepID=UPI003D14E751